MEKRITRPQIKKLLKEHGKVTLDIFDRGKDPNDLMTAIMQITIKDINELDDRVKKAFKKFSGREQFSCAIWEDEE